jgi:hypothetical protein
VVIVALVVLAGCASTPSGTSCQRVQSAASAVEALALDPHNSQTLYARSYGSLFKTTNGGRSWRRIAGKANNLITAFVVNPASGATLYAADFTGLLKSTDGGAAWRGTGLRGRVLRGNGINALAGSGRVLYAALGDPYVSDRTGPIVKSTDAGLKWRPAGLNDKGTGLLAIDPRRPRVVYAATTFFPAQGGVVDSLYKSVDGGVKWRRLRVHGYGVDALAINSSGSILYAGTPSGAVLTSANGGASWRDHRLDDTFGANALALDLPNPRVVYAGTNDGLYKSADAGGTWQRLCLGGQNVAALAIDASASVLYAGTDSGAISVLRLAR